MSFKAVITEKYTEMNGTGTERLAGLACYIDALIDMGIPKQLIKLVVGISLNDDKTANTIFDNDEFKIQKIDLNKVTEEEAKKIINEEIKKMFE